MKFKCQVDINKPLDKVVKLWQDPDNLKYWQEGFQRIEHLSGTAGQEGAQSRIYFQSGKRDMELLETIMKNDLPDEFVGKYEHTHMVNTMTNRFEKLTDHSTRYTADIHYTQFNGIMPKLMSFLFPGMFRKQVQKWLDKFKEFVESN